MNDPFQQKTPAKEVSGLIDSRTFPINHLLTIAKRLALFEEILNTGLGPQIQGKIRCAYSGKDELVLVVPSSSLASSLRLREVELIELLKTNGASEIQKLRFKTNPAPFFAK